MTRIEARSRWCKYIEEGGGGGGGEADWESLRCPAQNKNRDEQNAFSSCQMYAQFTVVQCSDVVIR